VVSSNAFVVASSAARGFKVLQCQECAQNIKNALLAAGHHGQLIEIRGTGGRDFMICVSHDGGQATITQNERHVGVRIDDTVFDNLHPDGMPFDQWLKDFDAIGGVEVYSTTSFS
jgi:hypothetical protein